MSDDKKVIFSMQKLSKTYPGADKQVLKNIYLSFFYGAKIGILGLNGSGKSSLLKIIAGVDKNYQGDVVFQPGYTVGYLEQEPHLDETKTVIDIVREGAAETFALLEEFNKINDDFGLPEVYENPERMEKLMDRQAELQDKIDASGAWEIDNKLEIAMDALRTPDPETPISVLSGGEKRRVALCRLLLQQPDVLLLDEPTNHLDAESVLWLEQHLAQYSGTVIAVTHDRYFLDNVAGWILELDRGEGIPWKGNYSSWLEQKSNRMAQEEKVASKRRKNLERELDWVRQGAKGRQTKQKARLQNYDKLLNEDVNYEQKENNFLNQNKTTLLQNESKKIFIKYLEENQINFLELKDRNIKLSSENFKSFFNNLKALMSDKKTLKYKEERAILQKIYRYKVLKISFSTNNNDEYQTLYLYLNHPIIMMILGNKTHGTVYTNVLNKKYQNMYGIIYRVDIRALKEKSIIKIIILNKNIEIVKELDYFEIIKDCDSANELKNSNLENVKNKSISIVAKNIESIKKDEAQKQMRLINIKIDSINSYFEKQINKVKKLEQKVSQEDVKRMRIGEIENLKNQRAKKVEELENQKDIQSSFEILGVMEII